MTNERPISWWLFLFISILFVLSAYFVYKPLPGESAPGKPQQLKQEWYTVETARETTLKNTSIVGNCHLCHAFWVPIPRNTQTSSPRFAHGDIKLNHGRNNRCYNCHMISDRNKYVADDGSAIMVQLPEKLCSRCHGLIYNDWQQGTHGKWTGKWNSTAMRDKKTYSCTQCHDPHDPKFKYARIAPPPVWPDKYIRTKLNDGHTGPFSNFRIEEEPKEIF